MVSDKALLREGHIVRATREADVLGNSDDQAKVLYNDFGRFEKAIVPLTT
jgi:hypothetical protein